MRDSRRKKAEVEHLLKVDKEVRITFTMADGTVVALEDVDVDNRVIRERRKVI